MRKDPGSMVWDVSSRNFCPITPDRAKWSEAHGLHAMAPRGDRKRRRMGSVKNGDSWLSSRSTNIQFTQETEITGTPLLARRIYGPGKPGSGSPPVAETIYTVPAGRKNDYNDAPRKQHRYELAARVGFYQFIDRSGLRRHAIFSAQVDPGFPSQSSSNLTLKRAKRFRRCRRP